MRWLALVLFGLPSCRLVCCELLAYLVNDLTTTQTGSAVSRGRQGAPATCNGSAAAARFRHDKRGFTALGGGDAGSGSSLA